MNRNNDQRPIAASPQLVNSRGGGEGRTTSQTALGLSQREIDNYSISRLMRSQCGLEDRSCPELDMSQAIAQKSRREAKGCFVPFEVLVARSSGQRTNGALTTAANSGGSMIATEVSEPTEFLRSRMVLAGVGVDFLNLDSELSIPKQREGASGRWLNEGEPLPEEDVSFDPLVLRPRSLGSLVNVTRKAMIQASINPSIEQFILNDIGSAIAASIQRAALVGSEAANEPTGILSNPEKPTDIDLSGAALTYSDILRLEAQISEANIPLENLSMLASPQGIRKLRETSKDTGSGEFLLEAQPNQPETALGMVLSYPCWATSSLPDDVIILGNFADLIVATFGGGVDLMVNPFGAGFAQAVVSCRGVTEVTIGVRRDSSFAVLRNFDIS